jgi:hypothetical protein
MRRGEKTPEDLDRPDGNSLEENYKKHDVGEAEVVTRIERLGYSVEEWGIDMRGDSGADGVIYDDKMDFKVTDGDETLALLDVKTKGSPRYMGRFNERHYTHYHQHSKEHDVPVFIVMFQVDYKTNTVHDEFVFEVGRGELGENVHTSSDSDAVNNFPDGNNAVLIPHGERRDWNHLESQLTLNEVFDE